MSTLTILGIELSWHSQTTQIAEIPNLGRFEVTETSDIIGARLSNSNLKYHARLWMPTQSEWLHFAPRDRLETAVGEAERALKAILAIAHARASLRGNH